MAPPSYPILPLPPPNAPALTGAASPHPTPIPPPTAEQVLPRRVAEKLDLVVTLGGDGTVLWTCGLFGNGPVPPIVPFAQGALVLVAVDCPHLPATGVCPPSCHLPWVRWCWRE